MAERAVFLSQTAAHMGIIKSGRAIGLSDETIAMHGRTYLKYKQGEFIGWEAMHPMDEQLTFNTYVMEEEHAS